MSTIFYYNYKKVVFKEEPNIEIIVKEILQPEFGCYLWPSAIILTSYLFKALADNSYSLIFEIGAGVGVCGMLVNAKFNINTLMSDYDDVILDNLNSNVTINQSVLSKCSVKKLDWTKVESAIISTLPNRTLVVGADVFYDPKDFEALIQVIASILHQSPHNDCIIAYQERSSKRSLTALLKRFKLRGRQLSGLFKSQLDEINSTFDFYQGVSLETLEKWKFTGAGSNSVFLFQIYV